MLITLKRWDEVPDFYISFDSQEAIEYLNNFKISFFWKFWNKKIKNSKNLMTPICAGGSSKEWVCSVSRDKDGDTRIWVPGLIFSSLIVQKWWNRILIDYVPSHQGRAAIHRPECSLRSVECVLMHNNTIFPFLHFVFIYLFKWHKVFVCGYLCATQLSKK